MAERVAFLTAAGESAWAAENEQCEKGMESEKEKDDFKDKISDEPPCCLYSHTVVREMYAYLSARRQQAFVSMPELPPELG